MTTALMEPKLRQDSGMNIHQFATVLPHELDGVALAGKPEVLDTPIPSSEFHSIAQRGASRFGSSAGAIKTASSMPKAEHHAKH